MPILNFYKDIIIKLINMQYVFIAVTILTKYFVILYKKIFIMALKKQYLKSKPVCKVTFSLLAKEAKSVFLVGNFNEWNTEAAPLKKLKNGTFKTTLDLDAESSYEYKYVVDGAYINDEAADAYAWNDYACTDNSVVNV